jgi:hypothetical protein
MSTTDDEIFDYTGEGGNRAPLDVVRVRVDPSVTSIPAKAFYERKKLAEVELCEGLVEIGERSFSYCYHSITMINIPNSLRRINGEAFYSSLRTPIRLHDDIESIGEYAFAHCIFMIFRLPPLITLIAEGMFYMCKSMFSLELPEDVTEIGWSAFEFCYCLRNVAFPPDTVFGDDIFIDEDVDDDDNEMELRTDLQLLFDNSNVAIMRELQHRFDGLPIHSIVYYQLYHHGVLQTLIAAKNMTSGQNPTLRNKLDPTGNQQDCLGMTPLHILACSSVHNIEVYHIIVENYPTNLISEDRWGALPLLYAFWGTAPSEIITFLLESYTSLYPGQIFNWTMMVETMGRCDTPKERIENLLSLKEMHFPSQPIDWEYLLEIFAQPSWVSFYGAPFQERMQFLFKCCMSDRVEALPFKVWRDHITNMIQTAAYKWGESRVNLGILHEIRSKLDHFKDELLRLKEATSGFEISLPILKTKFLD